MIAEDELGLLDLPVRPQAMTKDERLVAVRNEQEIRVGAFYVHRGVLTYVAEESQRRKEHGRINSRLRCIFENGTEADLLLRSFSSQLYRFGKGVTDPIEQTNEAVEV